MTPRSFFRNYSLGIFLLLFFAGPVWAQIDEATRFLEKSASLMGPAGWINMPAAAMPDAGYMSAGIHSNYAKLSFGLWDFIEAGIYFEADKLGERFKPYRDLSSWEKAGENIPAFVRDAFRGHAKLKALDQDWAGVGLAAGIEEQNYYVVAQRYLVSLSQVTLSAGWGTGRFKDGFAGLSKSVFSGAEVIFEYDGRGINIGMRVLLAPNLILSFAGKNLGRIGEVQNLGDVISEHMVFGVTYLERMW